jgi:tetratricopeptide (TPR) repeat protein
VTRLWRSTLLAPLLATSLPLAAAGQAAPSAANPPAQTPAVESTRIESLEVVDRIEADGTMLRRQRIRVRAIDAAGVAALSQVAVPFLEANQRVELTRLTLLKPDGRELDLLASAPRDVAPVFPPDLPIYSDLRVLRAAVPSIASGDLLDWETTVAVTPLAPGEAWTEATFSAPDQADLQSYELDVAESLTHRVHVRPGFEAVHTEERASGRHIRRWRLAGRPAGSSAAEPGAGEDAAEPGWEPDVSVSTFASWEEFGRWWAALAPPEVDDTVRARAADLVAGVTEPRAKLARLHRYVAQEIRYLTLPLGLGRYRARAPKEVIRTGLGDCKDKLRLLASLAAAVEIEVDPVLVGVERRRRVDGAPSPLSFDHVVARARLGDETIWMDPTSEMTAMGTLPAAARDLPGVAVVGAGAAPKVETVTTPDRPPVETSQQVDTVATIEPGGTIRAKVRWTLQGDDELLRLGFHYATAEQRRQMVDQVADDWGKTRELGAIDFGEPADLDTPFWFEYEVAYPMSAGIWAKEWDLWLPVPKLQIDAAPDPDEDTEAARRPLVLTVPDRQTITARIELPGGVRASAPVPVIVRRDFAELRTDYRIDGRTLSFERQLTLLAREVPPSKFGELAALRKVIKDDRGQEFDLAAAPELAAAGAAAGESIEAAAGAATPDAAELNGRCHEELEQKRHAEAERLCREAVELEPEHRWAWNNLGRALLGLGRLEEAESAFRRQLEVAPDDEWAWANLSRVAAERGDAEEALRRARQQVEVAPLGAFGYRELALRLLQLGKLEEAEAALTRAAKLDPDDGWSRQQLISVRAGLGRCAEVSSEILDDPSMAESFEQRNALAQMLLENGCRELALLEAWFGAIRVEAERRLAAIEIAAVDAEAMSVTAALVASWRAAGAIALERGDAAEADRWLASALALSASPDTAIRRAESLEALGRREQARLHYALAAAVVPSTPQARRRFESEVPDARTRARLEAQAGELSWKMRSVTLAVPAAAGAQGRLRLLFGSDGRLLEIDAVDPKLPRALIERARAAVPAIGVPPGNGARIPRRAEVHCSASGDCTLVYDWTFQSLMERAGAD